MLRSLKREPKATLVLPRIFVRQRRLRLAVKVKRGSAGRAEKKGHSQSLSESVEQNAPLRAMQRRLAADSSLNVPDLRWTAGDGLQTSPRDSLAARQKSIRQTPPRGRIEVVHVQRRRGVISCGDGFVPACVASCDRFFAVLFQSFSIPQRTPQALNILTLTQPTPLA
jgi:hypothetical protein